MTVEQTWSYGPPSGVNSFFSQDLRLALGEHGMKLRNNIMFCPDRSRSDVPKWSIQFGCGFAEHGVGIGHVAGALVWHTMA
jgi:hypothetical protein